MLMKQVTLKSYLQWHLEKICYAIRSRSSYEKSDSLNYETGIVFEKKVGDSVTQGDLIAKVYSQEILSEKMLTEFEKNVIMGSECKETTEILKIIR